jgi:hypothetical protein
MMDTKLGQQCIDGSHLDARAATRVPQFGGGDMVSAARAHDLQCAKMRDDVLASARTGEAL